MKEIIRIMALLCVVIFFYSCLSYGVFMSHSKARSLMGIAHQEEMATYENDSIVLWDNKIAMDTKMFMYHNECGINTFWIPELGVIFKEDDSVIVDVLVYNNTLPKLMGSNGIILDSLSSEMDFSNNTLWVSFGEDYFGLIKKGW